MKGLKVQSTYSSEELWNIAANLLHSPGYSQRYVEYIAKIIKDKRVRILDTACGTGFPSIDLYNIGYTNILGFDGNDDALRLFREKFDKIPLIHGNWKDINKVISEKFDILLNVDNALPYMDSWQRDSMLTTDQNEINDKTVEILKNFYSLTNPKGKIILGIAKNNDQSSGDLKEFNLGEGEYKGHKVGAIWKLTYDWKSKIKTFDNQVIIDGQVYHMFGKSYLLTKEDISNLLLKAGFARTEIIETDNLYDNFIIGYKLNP